MAIKNANNYKDECAELAQLTADIIKTVFEVLKGEEKLYIQFENALKDPEQ